MTEEVKKSKPKFKVGQKVFLLVPTRVEKLIGTKSHLIVSGVFVEEAIDLYFLNIDGLSEPIGTPKNNVYTKTEAFKLIESL